MFCCRGGCLLVSTLLSHRFTLHSIGCLKPPKTTIPSLRATRRAVSLMIWTDVMDESVPTVRTRVSPTQICTPQRPMNKLAHTAVKMLCCGIYTLHPINLLIADDLIWIWWYARQNAIQTSALNFVKDMPYLLALLAAFQRFTLANWQIEPSLAPPSMFIQPGPSEILIDVNFGNDVWPAGRMQPLNQSNRNMVKHLPRLITSIDIPYSETCRITGKLDVVPARYSSSPRTLRLFLFRQLQPLDEITTEAMFLGAWVQCFKCIISDHYILWENSIQHGDISVHNLMWDSIDSCGVFNDFDLSEIKSKVKDSERRSFGLTGTLPFMARDLLNLSREYIEGRKEQEYVHEVESLMSVLVWLGLRGVDLPQDVEWSHVCGGNIIDSTRDTKNLFISDRRDRIKIPWPEKYERTRHKHTVLLYLLVRIFELEVDIFKIYSEAVKIMDTPDYDELDAFDFYLSLL
ncbi:hypothetical protein BDQ17DRAFT_1327357 [Cyathus striatus]|nr:hypothetical protein BDQ17DRAFT_1327357 [Cyathus striatus]